MGLQHVQGSILAKLVLKLNDCPHVVPRLNQLLLDKPVELWHV